MNMYLYMSDELVDIHFINDLSIGNRYVAVRLCGEIYSMRQQPNHQTLTRGLQDLEEHGCLRAMVDDTPIKSETDLVA
ncbi:hypothetical protein TNCV_1600321 [Trichonephila clavipes]|nr:hypothetical protein TNCV_1600321 [Trichonephila clavipes]